MNGTISDFCAFPDDDIYSSHKVALCRQSIWKDIPIIGERTPHQDAFKRQPYLFALLSMRALSCIPSTINSRERVTVVDIGAR